MALGFAVANADHAHARTAVGSINRELLYELNSGTFGPSRSWLDRQKITTDGPSFGLISGHYPPDPERGGVRFPYQAEIEEIPSLLTKGWTPDDPASLEKFGYRIDALLPLGNDGDALESPPRSASSKASSTRSSVSASPATPSTIVGVGAAGPDRAPAALMAAMSGSIRTQWF